MEHQQGGAEEIRDQYDEMERRTREQHPGVMDLLETYGELEQAMAMSRAYLDPDTWIPWEPQNFASSM